MLDCYSERSSSVSRRQPVIGPHCDAVAASFGAAPRAAARCQAIGVTPLPIGRPVSVAAHSTRGVNPYPTAGCVWVARPAATCRDLHARSPEAQGPRSGAKWHSRGRGFDSHRLHFTLFTIRSLIRTLSALSTQPRLPSARATSPVRAAIKRLPAQGLRSLARSSEEG